MKLFERTLKTKKEKTFLIKIKGATVYVASSWREASLLSAQIERTKGVEASIEEARNPIQPGWVGKPLF